MNIDGHDVLVLTDAQIHAMAVAASQDGDEGGKYYIYEDKAGNVRFGTLEEIPAHLRRGRPIPISKTVKS